MESCAAGNVFDSFESSEVKTFLFTHTTHCLRNFRRFVYKFVLALYKLSKLKQQFHIFVVKSCDSKVDEQDFYIRHLFT
jgi:hypothetical protein